MGLKTAVLLLISASSALGDHCWHTDLRPHVDCDKFVQCSNGAAYVMPCAPGTLFDYENQICNHAWAVTCTQPEVPTTTTTPDPGYLPNGCPASFQEHLLLPHVDCSKFYQCVHGNKVEMICAAGTLFDYHLQICNWPNQVTCYSPTTTTNEPTTTTQRVYTTSTTEQATETTTEKADDEKETENVTNSPEFVTENPGFTDNPGSVTDSPETSSSEEDISESTDGSKEESFTTEVTNISDTTTENVYTEHTESTTVESNEEEYTTPTHTTETSTTGDFSETDKPIYTTDSPEIEESKESAESVQTTEKYETGTSEEYTTDDNLGSEQDLESSNESGSVENEVTITTVKEDFTTVRPIPEPITEAPICPAGFFGNAANPDDCSSYYLCSNGIAIPLFCADGYKYNSEENRCVVATEGPCAISIESQEPTTENIKDNNTEEFENSSNEVTSEEKSTELATEGTTPKDESLETTVNISDETDNPTEIIELTTEVGHTKPPPTTEPPTTVNENPEYITDSPEISSENDDNKTEDSQVTEESTEIIEVTTENESLTTVRPIPEPTTEAPICPAGFFGNVANPNDCGSYYMCSNGIAIPLFCAEGCKYDSEQNRCVAVTEGPCAISIESQEPSTESIEENNTEEFENSSNEVTSEEKSSELATEGTTPKDESLETTANISDETDNPTEIIESTTEVEYTRPPPTTQPPTTVTENPEYITVSPENSSEEDDGTAVDSQVTEVSSEIIEVTTEKEDFLTVRPVPEPTTEAPICPAGFFGNVANPNDCGSYYMCSNGIAIPLFCAEGCKYDSEQNRCVAVTEGPCAISIESQEPTTENIEENNTEEFENSSHEVTSEEKSSELATEGTTLKDESLETTVDVSDETDNPTAIESTTEVGNTKPPSTTQPPPTVTENPEYITDSPKTSSEENIDDSSEIVDKSSEVIDVTTEHEGFTTIKPIPEPTTEAPICPAGFFGNVANPDDCGSYYMCSNGIAIPLFCAEGYKYDSGNGACILAEEGPCALVESSFESSTTTENPAITNDSTNEEDSYEKTTEINETTISTDSYEELTTIYETETTESEISDIETTTVLTTEDLELTTIYTVADVELTTENIELTTEEILTTLKPTTEAPVLTTEDVELTTIYIVPDELTTENIELTTEEILTTVKPTTEAPLCAVGVIGNVAHPTDCDTYFLCSNGFAIQLFCPDGSEFDSEAKICVPIAEGGCKWQQQNWSNTNVSSNTENSNEHDENHRNSQENTNSNDSYEQKHEAQDSNENLESSESKESDNLEATYSKETNEDAVLEQSSKESDNNSDSNGQVDLEPSESKENDNLEGTYSKETNEDDVLESSIESDNNDLVTTERNGEEQICRTTSLDYVPHPDICNSYYMCTAGFAIQLFCTDGSEFNVDLQMCVEVKQGGCSLGTTNQENEDAENNGFEDNGNEVPENEVYENEGIENSNLKDEEEAENEGLEDGGIENDGTENEGIENGVLADEGQEIEVEKAICEGNAFGSVPHPEYCNSYYLCTGGFAITLYCADAMEFDPVSQQCQLIAEGGCTHEKIRYNAADNTDIDK